MIAGEIILDTRSGMSHNETNSNNERQQPMTTNSTPRLPYSRTSLRQNLALMRLFARKADACMQRGEWSEVKWIARDMEALASAVACMACENSDAIADNAAAVK